MVSTVSQGIKPSINIQHAERGMVQNFHCEYSKGDTRGAWVARKAGGCSGWKTMLERRHYETRHCSWSTHKLHNLFSYSSCTTNTGRSYRPFILYAYMNTDRIFTSKYFNVLANSCHFSLAPKGQPHIHMLILTSSGTRTMSKGCPSITAATPRTTD